MRNLFILCFLLCMCCCKKNESQYDVQLNINTPFQYGHGYAIIYNNSVFLDSLWFQGDKSFRGTFSAMPEGTNLNVFIRRIIIPEDTTCRNDTGTVMVQWELFNKPKKFEQFHFDSLTLLRTSSFNVN